MSSDQENNTSGMINSLALGSEGHLYSQKLLKEWNDRVRQLTQTYQKIKKDCDEISVT